MLKKFVMLGIVGFTSFAQAKREMTAEIYPAVLFCLNKLNAAHPYVWKSGSSPYAVDTTSQDHFIVLGRENAFVRFGTTKQQKCAFNMIHNATRDCVKIMNESGSEIVAMKYQHTDRTKTACNATNPESTTNYTYNPEKPCTDLSMKDLGQILQKQILVNIQKLITETDISRKDFNAQYEKDCGAVHNKIWDGIGSDYGATVSNAFKTATAGRSVKAAPESTSEVLNGTNDPDGAQCNPYPECTYPPQNIER